MSLLQERLEELGSAIINMHTDKIILTGFMSPERLYDYYLKNIDCRLSVGVYSPEVINIAYFNDDALIIKLENGVEKQRYQFEVLIKTTVKYKIENKKYTTKVYSIRRCKYTNKLNYKDGDKSILFDTILELEDYFYNLYNVRMNVNLTLT